MADRKVKCPVCGKMNNKEDTAIKNKRYYCPACLEQQQKEADAYKDLIEYVCGLFNIAAPTFLMTAQIKRFKEELGYTYGGMKATLKYFFEIEEGHSVEDSEGLGIIPYTYDKCKEFYAEKKRVKNSLEGNTIEDIRSNVKKIKVNNNKTTKKDTRNLMLIDIEDITDEEE